MKDIQNDGLKQTTEKFGERLGESLGNGLVNGLKKVVDEWA